MPNLPDYDLKFDHPQLEGVTVTMGRLTIAENFEFEDIITMPTTNREERRTFIGVLAAFVGAHMVAWNLTDKDGKPLPVGQIEDHLLLRQIETGWLQGLTGGQTASPLDAGAGPDEDFEAEIPVQPLPEPSGAESETAG